MAQMKARRSRRSSGTGSDGGTIVSAPDEPAWAKHSMSTSAGREALASVARSLDDLDDITAMRTYVRQKDERIRTGRKPLPLTQDILTALDEQEKVLRAGAVEVGGIPAPAPAIVD